MSGGRYSYRDRGTRYGDPSGGDRRSSPPLYPDQPSQGQHGAGGYGGGPLGMPGGSGFGDQRGGPSYGGGGGGRDASPPRYPPGGGGGGPPSQYHGGVGGRGGSYGSPPEGAPQPSGGRSGGGGYGGSNEGRGGGGGGGGYASGGFGSGFGGGRGDNGGGVGRGIGGGGGGGRGGRGGGRGGGGGGRNPRAPPPVFVPLPPLTPAVPATQTGRSTSEPVARQEYGTTGGAVRLITNTFDLEISRNATTWYKYEVVITPNQRARADGTVPPPRGPPPKSVLRAVWNKLELDEQAGQSRHLLGVQPAFDGRAAAYTNALIPTGNNGSDPVHIPNFAAPDRPNMTFSITVRNPIEIRLASMRAYMTGGSRASYDVGELSEALQALNVVFSHKPASLFYPTRTSVFVGDEAAETARSLGIQGVRKESVIVSDAFLELWRGYFQSVRVCPQGLMLNLNTTSTAFYVAGDLKKFVDGFFFAKGGRAPTMRVGGIDVQDLVRINRLLQKMVVVVDRGSTAPKLKVKIRGRGIVNVAPREHMFDTDDGRVSVEAYFEDRFRVHLRNPDWPLVEVKPGSFYPLELVRLVEGNKYQKRLTPAQQQLASSFQTLVPAEKLGAIMAARQRIIATVTEPFLSAFGISLDQEPKETHGRILAPPNVEYKLPGTGATGAPPSFTSVTPKDDSSWMMDFSRGGFRQAFVSGGRLASLMVIVESERDRAAAVTFFDDMLSKGAALGMNLSEFPPRFSQRAVLVRGHRRSVDDEIVSAMSESRNIYSGKNPDMIVWIFEQANSADYHPFKLATTRRGIASQALQSRLIAKTSVQVAVNVCMKLNAKLAGYSFRLERGSMGMWFGAHMPMLWGCDLSHEPDRPSVAVMVASMHSAGIVYEETARVQGLVEPPANNPLGRARKQEVIVDAEEMATFLLRRYILSLRKVPPNSHLVFRDGVSESEFSAVIDQEVSAFRRAFAAVKRDLEMEGIVGREALDDWSPKVTFIATLKRHHVRCFVPSAAGGATNLVPGTVIDRDVVDPKASDWYGAAHQALIGTTRATRYAVLVDEQQPRMTADELQATCHVLCHSFQRCTRAVSLPAPVFYADLIAGRIRGWLPMDDEDGVASSSGATVRSSSAATRQSDLAGAQAILDGTETGRDTFRGDFASRKPPAMWWA